MTASLPDPDLAVRPLPPSLMLDGLTVRVSGPEETLAPKEALRVLAREPRLVCHAPYLVRRLAMIAQAPEASVKAALETAHFDIAELFAFVMPAVAATPTVPGLARALGFTAAEDDPDALPMIAQALFDRARSQRSYVREMAENAQLLERARWPWARPLLAALAEAGVKPPNPFSTGLNVWDRLPEWEEEGVRPPGTQTPVDPALAQQFLGRVLEDGAERRAGQVAYCRDACTIFAPRQTPVTNAIVLAEAGTGLGKTLGYLAPSFLWSRENRSTVWLSTYTKNLQRQIEQETARLIPDPDERTARVVIRKGRENYACLLNMQEAFSRLSGSARGSLLAAIVARWALATRDGDMIGGDFPGWVWGLFLEQLPNAATGPGSLGFTDRRGECIFSACPHYRRCYIERAVRAARRADLVIANHAFVLRQAAIDGALGTAVAEGEQESSGAIRRLVFDEGHHLFDAADSAFSGHLTGIEAAELRRWIRGPEVTGRRGRGLADRLGELLAGDQQGEAALEAIHEASACLPAPGWQRRIGQGRGEGPTEQFLQLVRQQTLARGDPESWQSIETDCQPLVKGLAEATGELVRALIDLKKPMALLARHLVQKLDQEASTLNTSERVRLEAISRSLKRRSELMVEGWVGMLGRLLEDPLKQFVEWFSVDRIDGRDHDVGLHSHWVDPTEPLAMAVLRAPDGVLITSATLRDRSPEPHDDWETAEMRTGAAHLPYPVTRVNHDSPFDYGRQARFLVVTDIDRDDAAQVASAYRELFLAAGGGGLGIFTAINRLRAVHRQIVGPLAQAGLHLYAQHCDPIDIATLVDMFRSDRNACLLGTDAIRDGVDVPGDSLRLIVMDRVPWGPPTILERERRERFGKSRWQDLNIRLRLRQAFGRLIRKAGDRGVFVMLDSRLASRFATAVPAGVAIERVGLVDAIEATQGFLKSR
ncbi:MAG: ATP-dependent DNA helicase [Hyphomicrobiales bacterium]